MCQVPNLVMTDTAFQSLPESKVEIGYTKSVTKICYDLFDLSGNGRIPATFLFIYGNSLKCETGFKVRLCSEMCDA